MADPIVSPAAREKQRRWGRESMARRWAALTPDEKDAHRQKRREDYRRRSQEKSPEQKQRDREKQRLIQKAWSERNPQAAREIWTRSAITHCEARRDAKRDAYRRLTPEQYQAILARNRRNGASHRARHREDIRRKSRAWYAANKSVQSSRCASWRARNMERIRASNRAWVAANQDKIYGYRAARRAMEAAAEGAHTIYDILRILRAQRGRCAICRKRLGGAYHVDHIKALRRGGSNWPKNLQLTCGPCNSSKGAQDPIEYMRKRGRLL